MIDVKEAKRAAAGRWREILPALGGIDPAILDGRHHPCPRCGGRDRFSLVDAEAGAVLCRKCFAEKNGDGLAALGWLTGRPFPDVLHLVAEYLGLTGSNGNGHGNGSRNGSGAPPRDASRAAPKAKVPPRTCATADAAIEAVLAGIVRDGAAGASLAGSWSYHDPSGAEVLRVLRFDLPGGAPGQKPLKTFRPIYPVEGGWRMGDPEGPLPLYRLPEILASTGRIYVTEGEKAAEAGVRIGLTVTTSAHGAAAAGKTDWSPLAGREVSILPDRDDPGAEYAETVKEILLGLDPPAQVLIVHLPGLTGHGADLADYVEARDAQESETIREEIEAAVKATEAGNRYFISVSRIADMPRVEPPRYHADGLVFEKSLTLLAGDPKSKKTTLALSLGLCTLTGRPFLGRIPISRTGPVVVLEADMGESYFAHLVRQLAIGMGIDPECSLGAPLHYRCTTEVDLQDRVTRECLATEVAAAKPVLVLLDPLRDLHSGNENDSQELKVALDWCLRVRDETGAAVVLIDHLVKPDRGRNGGAGNGPAGYQVRGSGSKYGRADSVLLARDRDGATEITGVHRYDRSPEPLWVQLVTEEEGQGYRLVECSPPEDSDSATRQGPDERVLDWLLKNPGYHSKRAIAEGVKVRQESVRGALDILFGRGWAEHDGETANRRKWKARVPPDAFRDDDSASRASDAPGKQGSTGGEGASGASPLKGGGSTGSTPTPHPHPGAGSTPWASETDVEGSND